MTKYVTAIQAASIIGVSERTVREWVKDGKLSAYHPHSNRLAIPLSEVEAEARKRKPYYTEVLDMSDIAEKLATLEQKIEKLDELEAKHAALEEKYIALEKRFNERLAEWSVSASTSADIESIPPTQKRTIARNKATYPDKDLPPGCILARDFAKAHGVAPETFRDHFIKGIGRGLEEKDKVEVSTRPKPGRPKETEWFLTADQQKSALDFWRRHNITFTLPNETEE